MNNIINFPRLSEEEIIKAALRRLEKEKKDFYDFKGTVTFDKLLGIYKQQLKKGDKKSLTEAAKTQKEDKAKAESDQPEFTFNKNLGTNGQFVADGVIEDTYNALVNFINTDVYFASTILKSKGSFTGAIAYAIHKFAPEGEKNTNNRFLKLSDYEVFKGAVNFYFKDADVRFEMKIIKPDGFEPIEVTTKDLYENPDYKAALEDAQAEKVAQEKAKELAEKKAAEKAERKKKAEAKKKAKEAEAKKIAEFKKAQQSLFGENTAETTEPDKPTKPKTVKVKPSTPKKEESKPKGEQLSLFM